MTLSGSWPGTSTVTGSENTGRVYAGEAKRSIFAGKLPKKT
jgi:hypothetical protein